MSILDDFPPAFYIVSDICTSLFWTAEHGLGGTLIHQLYPYILGLRSLVDDVIETPYDGFWHAGGR